MFVLLNIVAFENSFISLSVRATLIMYYSELSTAKATGF